MNPEPFAYRANTIPTELLGQFCRAEFTQAILRPFGTGRVLLPVVHPVELSYIIYHMLLQNVTWVNVITRIVQVAQLAERSHVTRKVLGSTPGRKFFYSVWKCSIRMLCIVQSETCRWFEELHFHLEEKLFELVCVI